MSSDNSGAEAKVAGGYLREKFTIGMSRVTGDEVARALAKVTSHKLKIPNEKHMLRLLSASHGHYNSGKTEYANVCDFIIAELEHRTHAHNWIVVLKALLVFHRLMHDGSTEINQKLERRRSIFVARHLKDLADTPGGPAQQRFIDQYSAYLEERLCAQSSIGLAVRMEGDEFAEALRRLDDRSLRAVCEALTRQLATLTLVEYRDQTADNFATYEGYRRLAMDGKRLYVLLTDRVRAGLERFPSLEGRATRAEWAGIFRSYHQTVDRLGSLFSAMLAGRRAFTVDIPTLRRLPDALIARLEAEAASDGSGADDGVESVPLAALGIRSTDAAVVAAPAVAVREPAPTRVPDAPTKPQPALAEPQPTLAPVARQSLSLFADAPPIAPPAATAPRAAVGSASRGLDDLFSFGSPAQTSPQALPPQQQAFQAKPQPSAFVADVGLFGPPAPAVQPAAQAATAPQQLAPPAVFDPFDFAAGPSSQPKPKPEVVDFFSSAPRQLPPPAPGGHPDLFGVPPAAAPASGGALDAQGRPRAW